MSPTSSMGCSATADPQVLLPPADGPPTDPPGTGRNHDRAAEPPVGAPPSFRDGLPRRRVLRDQLHRRGSGRPGHGRHTGGCCSCAGHLRRLLDRHGDGARPHLQRPGRTRRTGPAVPLVSASALCLRTAHRHILDGARHALADWSRPGPRSRGCCHRTGSGAASTWTARCGRRCGRRRRSTPPHTACRRTSSSSPPCQGWSWAPWVGRPASCSSVSCGAGGSGTPRARRPSSDPLVTWRGSPASCRPGCSTRREDLSPGLRAGPAPRTPAPGQGPGAPSGLTPPSDPVRPCRHTSISERRPSPARRREGRHPRGPRGCRSRPRCRSATRSRSAVQTSRRHIASGPRSA